MSRRSSTPWPPSPSSLPAPLFIQPDAGRTMAGMTRYPEPFIAPMRAELARLGVRDEHEAGDGRQPPGRVARERGDPLEQRVPVAERGHRTEVTGRVVRHVRLRRHAPRAAMVGDERLPDCLDRLVRQTALAADRPHAVALAERLGEAHHAGARRRADTDLLVLARPELADVGRGVEQERS